MAKGHRSQIKRARNANKDTRPSAKLSYARMSVQKACYVLDVIRGKDVQTALGILTYNPRYASSVIKKLLESAIANAENNNGMNPENLYIAECYANKAPTMKRIKPRAQGRAYRILKRNCHITVVFWDSKWYAEGDFADNLVEDYNIRTFLKKKLYSAGISRIEIERASDRVKVIVYTAKPGVVIGKGGSEIEKVKAELQKYTDKKLVVDIKEVKRPDKDAQLVAENIALQLENRISFRRAMKSAMSRTMKAGAKGIKTSVSGRLGGADMARTEFYSEGTIPLQTLRADIDYGFAEADTTYGKVGVKTWVYNGEVLPTKGTKEGSDK